MGKDNKQEEQSADKVYQYDAFISYRHVEPDASIAAALHKKLESYKLPDNVKATLGNGHERIERVFRDEEELPIASSLEDAIVNALRNTEWLIVICSPRIVESQWCRLEIKTFIEMHGRDHVLAVLVEGEPDTSFPEELLYETVTTYDSLGVPHTERKRTEPLAADVRGKNIGEMKKKLEAKKLKLIAAMFSINYDALKQRHKVREARRKFRFSMAITLAALIIGVYSTVVMLRLDKQNKQIIKQNEKIEQQNNELLIAQAEGTAERSMLYCNADDRYSALQLAYDSCTRVDGIDMPYTAEGELALVNATNVYGSVGSCDSYYQLTMPGMIVRSDFSPNRTYYSALDNMGNLYVWRSAALLTAIEINGVLPEANSNTYSYFFIDDNSMVYLTEDGLNFFDLTTSLHRIISDGDYTTMCLSPDRSRIACMYNKDMDLYDQRIVVFDAASFNMIKSFACDTLLGPASSDSANTDSITDGTIIEAWISGDYIIYSVYTANDNAYVRVIDINNPTVIKQFKVTGDGVARAFVIGDNLYVVSASSVDMGNVKTYVTSFKLTTCEENWKINDNVFATKVGYFNLEDTDFITVTSYSDFIILNAATGEKVGNCASQGTVIRTYVIDDGLYVLTSRNAKAYIEYENGRFDNIFVSQLTNSDSFSFITADILYDVRNFVFVGKESSNIIYVFREVTCPELADITSRTHASGSSLATGGEYLEELTNETITKSDDQFDEMINRFHIDDEDTILYLVYDTTDEVLVVNRSNATFELYTESERIGANQVYAFEHGYAASAYYGMDSAGNYFVGSLNGGEAFRINSEGEVIAIIQDMTGLDGDNDIVVRQINGACMTQPLFTFDELLELAENCLAEYND